MAKSRMKEDMKKMQEMAAEQDMEGAADDVPGDETETKPKGKKSKVAKPC
jgi:hypothetical protein